MIVLGVFFTLNLKYKVCDLWEKGTKTKTNDGEEKKKCNCKTNNLKYRIRIFGQ